MDLKIKEYFKSKKFSNLEFLSNESTWENNKSYLGCYYFLLELQGKCNKTIFDKILRVYDCESKAYLYLAEIAHGLFGDLHNRHIPIYYFQQASIHDESDTQALWELYHLDSDCNALLKALIKDYEREDINKINEVVENIYVPPILNANYSKSDWVTLKKVMSKPEIFYGVEILIICCYFLGEYDEGKGLIAKQEHVNAKIIKKYLDGGCIDLDLALSKVYYNDKVAFLSGKPAEIYEVIKAEAVKGNINPTKEAVAKYAFEAEKYEDVLVLVEELLIQDKPVFSHILYKLYHLLSSISLGRELNNSFVHDVEKESICVTAKGDSPQRALYFAFQLRRNMLKLESNLERDAGKFHYIENEKFYQDAKLYLNDSSLGGHLLYDLLHDELRKLKLKWDRKIASSRVIEISQKTLPLNRADTELLGSLLIDTGEYEGAISRIEKLEPTMTSSNLLGVAYQRLGRHEEALKQYKLSWELMNFSGESDDVIIRNYYYSLKKLGVSLPIEEHKKLKDSYNHCLANHFRYGLFTAENNYSLYKYYPLNNNTLDALINNYFYLASAEQLNDPIELPYNSLDSIKHDELIEPNFKLSSFSNNENSMLMWSHYTENHEGIMIEYCFKGDLPDGIGMARVDYSSSNKRLKEKELYVFNQYMLTKNEEWSYEEEVRLFAYNKSKVYYEHYQYPQKQGGKAFARINSITLGYKFTESMIKLIISIISNLNVEGQPKIILRSAKLSTSNSFELEYEEISY